MEPIFEADLEPEAYGYRPQRCAQDAIQRVHKLICEGYTEVVDADLSKYFDSIPHSELLQCVARRIVDRDVLHLTKMWLQAPVEERDENGKRKLTGGQGTSCGTPQGGVISPLLANLYMNRFLKYWRITKRGAAFGACIVNYADDFVIVSRGHAVEAMAWTLEVMRRIGLTLNEQKTSIKGVWQESFDFLGYPFGVRYWWKTGGKNLAARPSKQSERRLRGKVRQVLQPSNVGTWEEVRDRLNRLLKGWAGYFSYGTLSRCYARHNRYVADRARDFLGRRQQVHSRGTRRFGDEVVFGKLGVVPLQPKARRPCVSLP